MRQTMTAILALGLLAISGETLAQSDEGAAEADATATTQSTGSAQSAGKPWWEQEEETHLRGYIGGLLGAGFGVNGQLDTAVANPPPVTANQPEALK